MRAGEIVGIAGVAGNGQEELVEALIGLRRPTAGTIRLAGHDVTRASVETRRDRGIAFVPADRHRFGLVLTYPLDDNLALTRYAEKPFAGGFAGIVRNFSAIRRTRPPDQGIRRRAPGPKVPASSLSREPAEGVVAASSATT